jgi:hypothetical protein
VRRLSQDEMRSEVFRSLRPEGLKAIHWISEWSLDSPAGRRGIVRFRAVFDGHAPDRAPPRLWEFAMPADGHVPQRIDTHVLEFHIIYGRTDSS